jgi:hypothetical protein
MFVYGLTGTTSTGSRAREEFTHTSCGAARTLRAPTRQPRVSLPDPPRLHRAYKSASTLFTRRLPSLPMPSSHGLPWCTYLDTPDVRTSEQSPSRRRPEVLTSEDIQPGSSQSRSTQRSCHWSSITPRLNRGAVEREL